MYKRQVSEYIFIDTESNQNLSTKQILFDADIVVVNLTQNPDNIRDFFENYTSVSYTHLDVYKRQLHQCLKP